MSNKAVKQLKFCAAHRLLGHEAQCANLHGHNYMVEVEVRDTLDKCGRILDFSMIKDICGRWLDDNFDHALILNKMDELERLVCGKKYIMDDNPTAENMAALFMQKWADKIREHGAELKRVRVWETETSYAEVINGL